MTSVVGLDIGSLASKIGLARNRGIDIIANEVSNRATPSLVAFGPRTRTIGESAKTQETSNFKNTIGSLKRLIGRSASDVEVTKVESRFLNAELVDVKGSVGVKVNYLGEEQVFSATQLYASYLGRLRDIAKAELKNAVNDVVIAVPGWYTDIQRRAVLDAAEVANLHCLRLINETTATALGYGITKTDLPAPEENARHIAFVDIGHSQYQVSIVAFHKGTLTVKAYAYDHHFGGRDLDHALVEHFAAEFQTKYKIDVLSNKKAIFRLAAAVEKLKKVLSANAQAPLNVESIMNDIDASSSLTREDFEGLVAPLLERTVAPLERALAQAGLTKDEIDAVELVGGSTRVPALKTRIQEFFGKHLSFTCNQDEAIARGATLACAILSPVFKVRDFTFTDLATFPINVNVEVTEDDPTSQLTIIEPKSAVPSGKVLTFPRKAPFEIEARYADPANLPGGINPYIGRFVIKEVPTKPSGEATTVRVVARLTANGTFSFDTAQAVIEVEPVEGESMGAEGAEGAAPEKKVKRTKKELKAVFMGQSLDKSIVNELLAKEGEMYASDKLVAETEDRKNALEEYVYDTREKLDGTYAPFVTADVKETLKAALQKAEDWLYSEEGEDASKSQYVARLDELNKIGGPIKFRQREYEDRPRAERSLREAISSFESKATGGEEKYSHLAEADLQTVLEKCASATKWLGDLVAKQAERRKSDDAAVTSAEILKKREALVYECTPIFNKPKPKVANTGTATPDVPPKKEGTPAEPAPEAEMADAEAPLEELDGAEKPVEKQPVDESGMDVD